MKAARCREQDTAAPELPCPYTAVFDTGACLVHAPAIGRRRTVITDAMAAYVMAHHAARSLAAVRASFAGLAEAVADTTPAVTALADAVRVHSGQSDPVADSAAPLQMGDPPP